MLFLDTLYLLALINPKDAWRERALSWAGRVAEPLLTTDAVLVEVADALCATGTRGWAAQAIEDLRADDEVTCVRLDGDLFERSFDLYCARTDKSWSLTDCISFTVMRDRGVERALTADVHFAQAGFVPLLRQDA